MMMNPKSKGIQGAPGVRSGEGKGPQSQSQQGFGCMGAASPTCTLMRHDPPHSINFSLRHKI